MINILYYDLLALINNNELIPSSSYRITNYSTTTAQADTTSAGHDFDIIVTALDENTLSENASAVQHEGDIYFENSRLESWKLKYCIDNDTNRFAWADNVNGKGVIYYMKDKWGNECPYDFKNIQYLKNSVWVYTFGGATDNSLIGECHHNKINLYISSNKQTLNNITFGNNCMNNTFGDDCYNITFGNDCNENTFGSDCHSNTFGDYCYQNTFYHGCYSNTFLNNCMDNTFVTGCNNNTFGDYCYFNTFGNNCNNNTFGDYCKSNTFGNNCNNNTFGNYFESNTFGDDCLGNNFYHGISGTTPMNYIRYIVLEDGVSNNNFYSDVNTDIGNYLQRIRIKGLENTSATDTIITLSTANTQYEWVIDYNKNNNNVIQNYPDYLVEYEKIKTITSTINIELDKQYKIYKYNHSSGNIVSFSFSNTKISDLGSDAYTFEMEIQMPSGGTSITFPSSIVPLNGTTIMLEAGKKNYLAFRTFDGINFIVNYQGFI